MESDIRIYREPDGSLQRVQRVCLDHWEELNFLPLQGAQGAVDCFAEIYRKFLVPACPWLFGNMVLFQLAEGMEVPFSRDTDRYGRVADPLTAAAAALERNVRIRGGCPRFRDEATERFWKALEERGLLRVVSGKLPVTTIIPVSNGCGRLSQAAQGAAVKVNSAFFIMDRFDCATVYDHIGSVLGLQVRNGVVLNPPLYGREALLVARDGSVQVRPVHLEELTLEAGGSWKIGKNAELYTRPAFPVTPPRRGRKLVIVGCQVAAVSESISVRVPASGFVLIPKGECTAQPGDLVTYRGMEDVAFGIQVGNSIVKDGIPTDRFLSKFYNIRHLQPVPYPPSLYPMGFERDRAARIALGADRQGRPMLLWAEGAAKIGHDPGRNSRGATLADMGRFCVDAGMVHAINLDGGGSAQLLLHGKRALQISDRNEDGTEAERLVPQGLVVE